MQAMTTAESSEYGVVRMIVDDVDAATEALKQVELPFSIVDVLGIEFPDTPGALGKVALQLAKAGENVDNAYITVASQSGNALGVFRVADPPKAEAILLSGSSEDQ